ncbi:MAG: PKD domain-containing protein [Crocinitomix sp.]|nr:PKD domain-containing protein [Crocinitomix sp.]
MKKRDHEAYIESDVRNPKFMQLKSMVILFLLTLFGTSTLAQPNCPAMGWENEPIQDPDGCCILFDMLPSTLDFPWAYWFVVADGATYNSSTYPTGEFPICFDDAGMENVVVTYVDAFGITLCENDWTVFVETGCAVPCEDCVDFVGIEITTADECTYDFEMSYTVDLSCGEVMITSLLWDFGDGTFDTESSPSHTFPDYDAYTVTATIVYTVDGEPCSQEQTVTAWAWGCGGDGDGFECAPFEFISSTDTEMTMGLPTAETCVDPTYQINITEFGSGDPLAPATFTTTEVSPDVWEATITGLDPCTAYEVQAVLLCDGLVLGSCSKDVPWETNCPAPCTGCLIVDEIAIISFDGCEYRLEAVYEETDACGVIDVTSVYWDFGDGNTDDDAVVDVSFLCEGMKTVTATIYYTSSLHPDIACVVEITEDIDVIGCDGECPPPCEVINSPPICEDCLVSDGISLATAPSGCVYQFIMDYATNEAECGTIGIISIEWDFGDGTTGTGPIGNHTYAGDGTYTVTGVITYLSSALGIECTHSACLEVHVTGCGGHAPKMAEGPGSGITATTVPNPADEMVTITVLDPNNSSGVDQLELVIFDINGREVYRGNTTLGSQKMINVSHFESGLYIYEVRDGETVILKEKLLIK